MMMSWLQVVAEVVAGGITIVAVLGAMGVAFGIPLIVLSKDAENNVIDVKKARKLSSESSESPKEEGWSWKERFELHKVGRKIERACEKGCRNITLNYSLRYKVVECLKEKGYKVIIETIDAKPIGTVIEW